MRTLKGKLFCSLVWGSGPPPPREYVGWTAQMFLLWWALTWHHRSCWKLGFRASVLDTGQQRVNPHQWDWWLCAGTYSSTCVACVSFFNHLVPYLHRRHDAPNRSLVFNNFIYLLTNVLWRDGVIPLGLSVSPNALLLMALKMLSVFCGETISHRQARWHELLIVFVLMSGFIIP